MRQSLLELDDVKHPARTKPAPVGERGHRIKVVVALIALAVGGTMLYNHLSGPALVPGQSVDMEIGGAPTTSGQPPAPGLSASSSGGEPAPATSTTPAPTAPVHLPRPAGPTMVPNG